MNNDDKTLHIVPPKRIEYAVATAFFVLAAFLVIEAIAAINGMANPTNPPTNTVTVQGNGQATLPPDVANVSFTVQNTAAAVADAQSATTKQANAAIAYVKAQGIADKDVKTASYNISPQYSYPRPCVLGGVCPTYDPLPPKITGYQVSETIQVKVRDLASVGTLLAGLGKLSVQNLNGPDFALDDPTAGYNAARADAIAKAQTQAALLSKQLGVHFGKIVNFSESSGSSVYPVMYGAGVSLDSKAASPTPVIPAGENTYNASVSITYEI